jgi:hypothetical protein
VVNVVATAAGVDGGDGGDEGMRITTAGPRTLCSYCTLILSHMHSGTALSILCPHSVPTLHTLHTFSILSTLSPHSLHTLSTLCLLNEGSRGSIRPGSARGW